MREYGVAVRSPLSRCFEMDRGGERERERESDKGGLGWAGLGWLPESRGRRCQKSTYRVHGFDANRLVSKRQAVKVHVDVPGTAMARRSSSS
jgi:hypothetical protein